MVVAQADFAAEVAATTTPSRWNYGGGGGRRGTSDEWRVDLGAWYINTPEQQRLIDEGIGVQLEPGTPVVAPGEMPVTQQEMDDFNAIPVTPQTQYR